MDINNNEKGAEMVSVERKEYAKESPDWTIAEDDQLSAKEGRHLRLKLDGVVLTLVTIAYLTAYLDRNNIGAARLMHFQRDLHISDGQFYDAVMIFYAGYLVTIFPANLMLQKIGPRIQFGGAAVLFGTFSCCMAAARNWGAVMGLRVLLGSGEALLQSIGLYLITLYGREHLTKRIAILYSSSTLAGCFAGLIAYGVQRDLEHDSRATWQWLFIIEGSIAILVGLCMAALLPPNPNKAKSCYLLTQRELQHLKARSIELDGSLLAFDRHQARQCLVDIRVWLIGLLSVVNIVLIASVGAFLPTIIRELGFTSTRAQLMSAIPYAIAFVAMLFIGYISDMLEMKGYLILGGLTTAAVGFIVLLATDGQIAGMAGACLVVLGVYPSAVLQQAWVQITFCGKTKRALAWGIAMLFGQGTSLAAAHFYTNPPHFVKGHAICLGFVVSGMLATAATVWTMKRDNKARDDELASYAARGDVHPGLSKSVEEMCDMHISFRYLV